KDIRAVCVDDGHARLIRDLGTGSVISVPLIARAKLLGALTLVSGTVGHFQEGDLFLAQELARRAALSVDNALLLEAESRSLQRLARMALAVRDMANTPLQTLKIAIDLMGRTPTRREELLRAMAGAIHRLEALDKALSSYASKAPWSKGDESFDPVAI